MEIKVSVIIPIYNMAEWIGKAIETVEKQTLKEIEIICIDDGSTDNSLNLLQSFETKYSNIIVLHQENTGSGPARNLGIDNARGEYIAFLDSDDYYYSDDALEILYNKAIENNAMICRGSSCDDRDGIINFKGLRKERFFYKEGYIYKEDFPGPTGYWAGIFNREFLINNSIYFKNLRRGQDGVFFTEALSKANKIYCIPKIVYVYRKDHKDVIYTEEKAVASIKTMYEILRIASDNNLKTLYKNWKNELFGEQSAMLYKFAADGNQEMIELASKLNEIIGGGIYVGNEIKEYVEKVKKEKRIFLDYLKSLDSVYVFGAGTLSRLVVSFLIKNEIVPKSIIVSDTTINPKVFYGISVESINAIDIVHSYEVIISTFKYNHEEIINYLKKNGIMNYIPLDICAFHLWQDEIIH